MLEYIFSPYRRIGRAKFWLGLFISSVVSIVGLVMTIVLDGQSLERLYDENYTPATAGAGIPWILSSLLGAWITVVTGIKRCHDRGQSGFGLLFALVPIIGWIWYVVNLGILKGNPGPNKYGPDPFRTRNRVPLHS